MRDTSLDYYRLMAADLNYTDKRLLSDREDGCFARNAKNLFNLFVLHDPLINKIILKMQEHIVRDTDPDENNCDSLPWCEYGDLLSETMADNSAS